MPVEAKIGLLLGIALTITVAIFLRPKEGPAPLLDHAKVNVSGVAKEVQGKTMSNRK